MKKLSIVSAILLFALFTTISSCKQRNPANEKRYDLKGKVVAVDKEKQSVTIDHEEVKDFMPAMTMPFTLKDDYYLQNLMPGDEINAVLVVDGARSWLENVMITRETKDPTSTTAIHEPKEGDEVPDFSLVNQDGKDIRLKNYRGKALLLTFIYTRCPIPDYCDLMSNNFAKVDRELQQQVDVYSKIHLLSISIDPEYDTPKVLRSYGAAHTERYQDETFQHWEFVTGTKDQIQKVAQYFGLTYVQDKDQIVHGLRTVIITPGGKVFKIYRDNKWEPEEVAKSMSDAAKL